jgi:trimethylamine monooxygenase
VERSGVRKYMRFNTSVQAVAFSKATGKFSITTKDLVNDTLATQEFDYVINATGHFSTPNIPAFEGMNKFPAASCIRMIFAMRWNSPARNF